MPISYEVPGPCTIKWGGNDLGVAREGIRILPRSGFQPITDDDHGEAPASFIFTGKGCVVELIGLDMTLIKAASPIIEELLQMGTATIGQTIYSDLGKVLLITERNAETWQADVAAPSEPAELYLASTQEMRFPVAFLIVPDSAGKLFSAKPDYVEA